MFLFGEQRVDKTAESMRTVQKLVVTSASLLVTGALLVVTRFATRNKCLRVQSCEFRRFCRRHCKPTLGEYRQRGRVGWLVVASYQTQS